VISAKQCVEWYHISISSDKSRFPKVNEVIHGDHVSRTSTSLHKGGPEPGLAALENLVEESRTNQYWKVARAYSNSLFNFPKDISLDEFSPKLALLMETIKKYPNDKHFVYSAFHERRGYGGHGARGILSIDYVGWVCLWQEGHSRPEKRRPIISGSNEVTSVVKAYNNESRSRRRYPRSHRSLQI
jgi:hypothetical protein